MRKFKYVVLSQIKGEVSAKDIPEAVKKVIDKFYEKMQNPEVLDFQYLHMTVQEIK